MWTWLGGGWVSVAVYWRATAIWIEKSKRSESWNKDDLGGVKEAEIDRSLGE